MGLKIVFLPAQQSVNNDNEFHQRLVQKIGSDRCEVIDYNTIEEFVSIIKRSVFVISMRLHVLVTSDICSVPVLGIAYSPKVRYYNKSIRGFGDRVFSINEYISVESIRNVLEMYGAYEEKIQKFLVKEEEKVYSSVYKLLVM